MNQSFKKFIRDFVVIAAISGVFILFLFANPLRLYERGGWPLLWAYYWRAGMATSILWLGNAHLSSIPDRWYTWVEAPVRRLLVSILLTVTFTCAAWILLTWSLKISSYGWNLWLVVSNMTLSDFIPTLAITFLISIFMHGRAFLLGWKETLVEAERLKREQISARYEALKSQVNPHFLFNSLNVLSSLVHKDADQAERFIHQLSAVYRYILDSRDKEVVSLEEEIRILRAYLFLMGIRFGAGLKVDIRLPDPPPGQVAPLTLQMLVENALKHNEASKNKPLRIEIFQEDGYLVVCNNVQGKNALPESTGVGLPNIQARYRLLSGKEVLISNKNGYFAVKIPVL